jgi:hypothetical protein
MTVASTANVFPNGLTGWLFCQEHGERFGWMRSPDARGADAYYRVMMAQASYREVM